METEIIIQKLEWIPSTVSVIWVFFTLLVLGAIAVVRQSQHKQAIQFSKLMFLLIASCWLFPTYIYGFQTIAGFFGFLVTFIIALFLAFKVRNTSKLAATLIAPVMLWSVLASFYTFLLLI